MRIGVVLPTLNEVAVIGETLGVVRARGRADVIVVADCASTDGTGRVAAERGAVVTGDARLDCRAAALAEGTRVALEIRPDLDAILFLHADSRPPTGWDALIANVLADPDAVAGAFDFEWDLTDAGPVESGLLRGIGVINRVRMRLTRSFYGDQGIFVRPSTLARIGGVPRVSLLEDLQLCRRLRRVGKLRLAAGTIRTSPRRFLRHGVIRQSMIDAVILAADRLGLEPVRLHAWYNREKA